MEKLYDYVKSTFVNFKLDTCCCVAPIRIGLLLIGYFNIFLSLLALVGTADDGYTPPLMAVQAVILEDDFSKPLGIVAYATEMAFNMILLSGIYRNDITLLRVYIYFVFASIVSSVLVYSIVFIRISTLIKTLIIWILVFQCYVILLVRSLIVEMKETRTSEKNGHVTLYSVVKMPDEVLPHHSEHPISEIVVEPKLLQKDNQNSDEIQKDVKLEKNDKVQENEESKKSEKLERNEEVQKNEGLQKTKESQVIEELVKNEKLYKNEKSQKNEKHLKIKKKIEKHPEPKNDETTSKLETVKEDLKELK